MVINTNLYATLNMATQGEEVPGGQFAWMETVLAQARKDKEKVHSYFCTSWSLAFC